MTHKIILLIVFAFLISFSVIAQSSNPPNIFSFDWSDDGSRLVTVTRTELSIYDELLNPIANEVFPEEISNELPSINLNVDGTRIYVGNNNERSILDTATLQPLVNFSDEPIAYWSSQWNSNSSEIAFRARDGRSTVIYDATNGDLLRTFSMGFWGAGYLNGFPIWSPDDRFFAGVIGDGTVVIFDAITGEEVTRYGIQNESIGTLDWSPDQTNPRFALTTYADVAPESPGSFPDEGGDDHIRNSVFFVDALSGTVISSVTGLRDSISRSAWHPNGIEFSGNDGSRRLYTWNANTGELIDSYLTEPYRIELFEYSPYGGRLAIGYRVGQQVSARNDDNFEPMTAYSQTNLDGAIEFVAPVASVERIQSILSLCATDESVVTAGNSLIVAGQYGEFTQWIEEQPSHILPTICADDLRLITEVLIDAN